MSKSIRPFECRALLPARSAVQRHGWRKACTVLTTMIPPLRIFYLTKTFSQYLGRITTSFRVCILRIVGVMGVLNVFGRLTASIFEFLSP